MVFIKTKWDDVGLKVDVDTRRTTLLALKQAISRKWIIQTTLQKLYFGDYNLEYEDGDLGEDGDLVSLAQLGVKSWSTLLLAGPVFRPRSFFDSDDAVYISCSCQRGMKMMIDQECESLMKKKMV